MFQDATGHQLNSCGTSVCLQAPVVMAIMEMQSTPAERNISALDAILQGTA